MQQPGDMVGEGETLRPCDRLSTKLAGNYVFVSPDAGRVHPAEGWVVPESVLANSDGISFLQPPL